MKIEIQDFTITPEKPREITIEEARKLFRTAFSVKRIFKKAFILKHGEKNRMKLKTVLSIS